MIVLKTNLTVVLLVSVAMLCIAAPLFHDVRPGYGVTQIKWLSDYHPSLRGTWGDTRIYILEGEEPGANVLLLSGTHTNEIAGIFTSLVFIEKSLVKKGRLFVVPWANNSAATWGSVSYDKPEETMTSPAYINFVTLSGPRNVVVGSRRTNPFHQETDPATYTHLSGLEFPGYEARNLDRVHPGRADGTLTEQISFALFELVRKEKIDMVVDLHEAGTSSRLANMLICNPKNLDMGAMVVLDLEFEGFQIKLEQSSEEFRGLSHREFGDHTDALAFLIETPNPSQDTNAKSAYTLDHPEFPLWKRVYTHFRTFLMLCEYLDDFIGRSIIFEGLPERDTFENNFFMIYN
ncbi:M14 family metallopeptidase [Thermotoga profunda]|uniref:succinylglutamate desuccinylase/aspartoacylase domain-containing protein n=1 Tax=Thermotoga profunda TaxID=1508420 RepID=UPI001E35F3DE|nr:succinylglutamate desuccinylase/aspartoacylase family protein [Thermotoga profunda]